MSSNNDNNYYIDDIINRPYIISDNNLFKVEENKLISHLDTSRIIFNLVEYKSPLSVLEVKWKNILFYMVERNYFI